VLHCFVPAYLEATAGTTPKISAAGMQLENFARSRDLVHPGYDGMGDTVRHSIWTAPTSRAFCPGDGALIETGRHCFPPTTGPRQ